MVGEEWKENEIPEYYIKTSEEREGFTKYNPDPKFKGVYAVRVHKDFSIVDVEGKRREGKKGDFLFKIYQDKQIEYPPLFLLKKERFLAQFKESKRSDSNQALLFLNFIQN